MKDAPGARASSRRDAVGMWLGVLAVALFGLTLPMTRLAIGAQDDPQLSPWFVTFGRAVVAALLSMGFVLLTRSPLPAPGQWRPLFYAAVGNAIGYPLLLGLALRTVTAGHAAVVTALLPLVTAVVATWVLRQRAGAGFWLCAIAGSALIVAYFLIRSAEAGHAFAPEWADFLLVGAVLAASAGYVYGAQVTPALGAERAICWVTIIALPVTLPGALMTWPDGPIRAASWASFGYVGVFSMWAGFFAWYRALAMGGAVRVSQVQMFQPFFAIAFAVPLLGEPLDALTIGFAVAVIATVFIGKRFHDTGARRG